jgi:hypothetical protein
MGWQNYAIGSLVQWFICSLVGSLSYPEKTALAIAVETPEWSNASISVVE